MKLKDLKALTNVITRPALDDQQEMNAYLRQLGMEPGMLYQELEMESRYADTHQDVSHSNAAVSLHSHTFYEILYCSNTCNAEYLVGTERYRLRKGDIVLVPPGVSHRPILPAEMEVPYKRYVLWLSADYVHKLKQHFTGERIGSISQTRMLRTEGTQWEYLGNMFRRGITESEKRKPGWEIMVVSNATQIVVHICRAILEQSAAPLKAEKPQLLDEVLAYVETHLGDKITLEDVAKRFWVSQSTITQTFRNKLGISFHRCVTQRRLIAAKSMIVEGTSLEQVAIQVGFSDYSSFYRAFKQEYGISPRQYRKMQEGLEYASDSMVLL